MTKQGERCTRQAGEDGRCWQHPHDVDESGLTDKQRRFVEEYCVDCNGAGAARRAGYSGDNGTLASVAYGLLRKPHVHAAIEERLGELAMTSAEALKRLSDWGRATIEPFISGYNELGEPILDLSTPKAKAHAHLIRGIKYDKSGRLVLELHDAMAATVHIAKAHGMFVNRVEHTGKDGGPIQIVEKPRDELLAEALEKDPAEIANDFRHIVGDADG